MKEGDIECEAGKSRYRQQLKDAHELKGTEGVGEGGDEAEVLMHTRCTLFFFLLTFSCRI